MDASSLFSSASTRTWHSHQQPAYALFRRNLRAVHSARRCIGQPLRSHPSSCCSSRPGDHARAATPARRAGKPVRVLGPGQGCRRPAACVSHLCDLSRRVRGAAGLQAPRTTSSLLALRRSAGRSATGRTAVISARRSPRHSDRRSDRVALADSASDPQADIGVQSGRRRQTDRRPAAGPDHRHRNQGSVLDPRSRLCQWTLAAAHDRRDFLSTPRSNCLRRSKQNAVGRVRGSTALGICDRSWTGSARVGLPEPRCPLGPDRLVDPSRVRLDADRQSGRNPCVDSLLQIEFAASAMDVVRRRCMPRDQRRVVFINSASNIRCAGRTNLHRDTLVRSPVTIWSQLDRLDHRSTRNARHSIGPLRLVRALRDRNAHPAMAPAHCRRRLGRDPALSGQRIDCEECRLNATSLGKRPPRPIRCPGIRIPAAPAAAASVHLPEHPCAACRSRRLPARADLQHPSGLRCRRASRSGRDRGTDRVATTGRRRLAGGALADGSSMAQSTQ